MTDNDAGAPAPGPAYDLHRTPPITKEESLDYSSNVDSDSYYRDGGGSSVTGLAAGLSYNRDATRTVHEMHLALLYLLSNPDEFKRALHAHPPRGATTLAEWNAEYDQEDEESVVTSGTVATPLPYVVFADDAEVVLPQAHTASQLFGIEKVEGIELEAAAGIPALSQLFLRWLALMPGGDHLNIIDPPGLTVMKIAGGRYRVTAAHRVVWTWMNEFATLAEEGGVLHEHSPEKPPAPSLQMGDLVSMTIIDVFETDNNGRLLSFCPTFDNRAVLKTTHTAETIRKSSVKFMNLLGRAGQAVAKSDMNKKATEQLNRMGLMEKAKNFGENVKHRVDVAVQQYNSPNRRDPPHHDGSHPAVTDADGFAQALTAAEAATVASPAHQKTTNVGNGVKPNARGENYLSDDENPEVETGEI